MSNQNFKNKIVVVTGAASGIDVLVNNAGITQRSAFADTKTSVYRQVMDVNFFGSLHCTKAAISSLIERKGVIIVIESLAGVSPLLGRTGYCASKHALHGFFTSL
jgi:NAD(P)-dependent dehydrogenase (short-subunit alcohol dehydrogenase family)